MLTETETDAQPMWGIYILTKIYQKHICIFRTALSPLYPARLRGVTKKHRNINRISKHSMRQKQKHMQAHEKETETEAR